MDPIGNTSGKSCDNDLRPSEDWQGMLADLRPFSPSPPRVAAVTHEILQSSKRRFLAMHPAMAGGHGASDGQASLRQEDPLHDLSREYMAQALNTGMYARFECLSPPPSYLRDMDAAVPPTGLAQGHPPVGESTGFSLSTGQTGATCFGGALEAPSGGESTDLFDMMMNRLLSDDYGAYDLEAQDLGALMADYETAILDTDTALPTSLAQGHPPVGESTGFSLSTGQTGVTSFGGTFEASSGGESTDLFDMMMNRLLSDDYGAYDLEAQDVQGLIADYEATNLDTGTTQPTGPAQEHPPVGESPGPSLSTGQTGATRFDGALEAPCGSENANLHNMVVNHLLSDEYEAYDPEAPNVRELMADYEATMLNRHAAPSTGQIGAIPFGERGKRPAEPSADPDHARKKKHASGEHIRITGKKRQALLHIFETEPERSNQSIMDEFGIGYSTIRALREKFSEKGNLEPGDSASRLTEDQRRAVSHVFETDPKRSNRSLANEFGVNPKTVRMLRKRFDETGNIKAGNTTNRLTGDQRQAIMHIFKTDPKRGNQSIAIEFGVNIKTIQTSRKRFVKTGNLNAGDRGNRLTDDQRRAIMHIFETEPKRVSQSIADEFNLSMKTIHTLKRRFNKIGDLKPGDSAKRLTADQRRAIMHIFETDPHRSTQSIVDEFNVAYLTIQVLRKQFDKTGDLRPGDSAKRLTADQRRAILHTFEMNSKKGSLSIADEFGVSLSTIKLLRRQFGKTGSIKRGDHAKRLTADQRQALLQIFETEPKRNNQSIADEFDISISTIKKLRRQFGKTGNLNPGDQAKRLTADQRRALLHIFKTDPERSNQSLVDEFDITSSTIQGLRRQFSKTGNIILGDRGNRLTAEQRRALLRIFETDPERSNQSIADEFGATYKTIRLLRKQLDKT